MQNRFRAGVPLGFETPLFGHLLFVDRKTPGANQYPRSSGIGFTLPRHSMQSRTADVEQVADLRAGEVTVFGRLLHVPQFQKLCAELFQTVM